MIILIICLELLIFSNKINISLASFDRIKTIPVSSSNCFDENCYQNLTNLYNSPLVECIYLPEEFYECESINNLNVSANCTRFGATKYSEVETILIKCKIFDYIECRGKRIFEKEAPCIKYTDKYFVTTLLYSIFLGIFAVDRCCIGHTGVAIGKLITLGGFGIWYIVDIILLVLGIVKPNDDSNWIPYY